MGKGGRLSRSRHSGPSDRRERVTERYLAPGSSDEHGARNGKGAASGEEFTTKPGASANQEKEKKTGARCELQRSGGAPDDRRSGRRRSERSKVPRHAGGNSRFVSFQNQMVAFCRMPTAKRPRTTDTGVIPDS